jgi:hypothetical protein
MDSSKGFETASNVEVLQEGRRVGVRDTAIFRKHLRGHAIGYFFSFLVKKTRRGQ